jgi:hypothetical protein
MALHGSHARTTQWSGALAARCALTPTNIPPSRTAKKSKASMPLVRSKAPAMTRWLISIQFSVCFTNDAAVPPHHLAAVQDATN